ncbi:unnamed protein product [Rhizophagus irregularis]|nr:unnamed protein product [Rhizophagus irregularis]CAB5359320.1 unnamed protein product [Rhizophagus irregularis]
MSTSTATDVEGSAFVDLTYEQLVAQPFGFSGGKATRLARVIKGLNSQKQPGAGKWVSRGNTYTFNITIQEREGLWIICRNYR